MSDPRVFFAAERTLLAWVRSGVTIMALGFVVAKFGLFLTLMSAASGAAHLVHHHAWTDTLGVLLVVAGAILILAAQYNHHLYVRTLPQQDVPVMALPWITSALSVSVALCGLLLAIYLALG
jgi:putative membrane protein